MNSRKAGQHFGFVAARAFVFYWIPACAGMTVEK
jgi:hypothetical protein